MTDEVTLAAFHEALLRIEVEARKLAWAPAARGFPSRHALRDALAKIDALRASVDAERP